MGSSRHGVASSIPLIPSVPSPLVPSHVETHPHVRRTAGDARRSDRHPLRLGQHLPRPGQGADFHRLAGPRGADAGRLRPRGRRPENRLRGPHPAAGVRDRRPGPRPRPGGRSQPPARQRHDRASRPGARDPQRDGHPPDPARPARGGQDRRGDAAALPLHRSPPAADAGDPAHPPPGRPGHPRVLRGPRVSRGRNAAAHQDHPGGGAGLHRALTARPRQVLRPAAEPPDLQADPDDLWLRPLPADLQVPPR